MITIWKHQISIWILEIKIQGIQAEVLFNTQANTFDKPLSRMRDAEMRRWERSFEVCGAINIIIRPPSNVPRLATPLQLPPGVERVRLSETGQKLQPGLQLCCGRNDQIMVSSPCDILLLGFRPSWSQYQDRCQHIHWNHNSNLMPEHDLIWI